RNAYFLPKFGWYDDIRPRTPGDVFVIPPEMIELFRTADPIKPEEIQASRQATDPNPKAPAPTDLTGSVSDSIAGAPLPTKLDIDKNLQNSSGQSEIPVRQPLPADNKSSDQGKTPGITPLPAPVEATDEENLGAPLD
ncbi:MAG: hypothetical protein K2L46_00925, partial [Paramuribaculum sp.]|nr:hypothetical protein [Paramuribaculum sp.]